MKKAERKGLSMACCQVQTQACTHRSTGPVQLVLVESSLLDHNVLAVCEACFQYKCSQGEWQEQRERF
jgi:hypothetical protein